MSANRPDILATRPDDPAISVLAPVLADRHTEGRSSVGVLAELDLGLRQGSTSRPGVIPVEDISEINARKRYRPSRCL